jgi:DNA (cytosine-5)-methyltransferase 1
MIEHAPIPIIDLFAGPGGLGEGFSSIRDASGNRLFRIALSIEKNDDAFRTLELRAFFRQFAPESVPDEYYAYLKGEIKDRKNLFRLFPSQHKSALRIVWRTELGGEDAPPRSVDSRIRWALINSPYRWVLIGGPPCQAYSTVGRSRMRGSNPEDFEKDPRHFLYREYLRILAFHNPPFFLMENVAGILTSRLNGESMFSRIMEDLQEPGKACCKYGYSKRPKRGRYKVFPLVETEDISTRPGEASGFVIQSEKYGIPQTRHRVFILGVRSDIPVVPGKLSTSVTQTTVGDVIADLPPLRSGLSREEDNPNRWIEAVKSISASCWLQDHNLGEELRSKILSVCDQMNRSFGIGASFVPGSANPKIFSDWYHDERLGGFCNHSARKHMHNDLHRYLFASCFAQVFGRPPLLKDFPAELLPDHKNVETAINSKRFFSDRFKVQLFDRPASTITCHMAKDGHYFIHPDPLQCRSFTVREAARLQTFPDNYFFEGCQTAQYEQVGNAVPPLLARAIARIVSDAIKKSESLWSGPSKRTEIMRNGELVQSSFWE